MRLGVSPAASSTTTGVFNQRFEALFPCAGSLGCEVCFASLPFLPVYLHANVGLPSPPAATLPQVLSTWLPISTPPTGLDECFFFNSLVVVVLYTLIFCQFWLFFVFKLVLSFFWWCEEVQCVYLRLHLGQKPRKIPGLLLRIAVTDPHSQRCLRSRCYYFLKTTHFIPICIHD